MGGPQSRRMNTLLGPGRQSELPLSLDTALLAHWSVGPGSAGASSIGSASPSLLSTDPGQTSAQWSIRHQGNALGHFSPPSPNPGLLSPPSAGPGSDASSIRSVSPSPSRPGFSDLSIPSPHSEGVLSSDADRSPDPRNHGLQSDLHPPYPLDEPAFRGRLTRRNGQHKDHTFSLDSGTRILFEGLSIEDGTSAEQSHYTAGTSPYHHNSATHSSGSLPEMIVWNGDGSSPPTEGPFGQSLGSPTSSSSYANYFAFLNAPRGVDTGHSSRAGRSRSHSSAPRTVDADALHGHSSGDRARRRRLSPYPVAGPSTRQAEGSNAPRWSADDEPTDSFSNRGRPFNAQGPFAMDLRQAPDAGGPSNSSVSWNADQSSQGDQGHAPGYRASVASAATVRAAHSRRKNKTKPGDYVCPHCQRDFTAAHNLRFHIDSHLSIKDHECGECGQRFGTPQVLKRHQRKCPSVKNEPVKP
ncbi:hypothetical protein K438DRAFT_1846631 [Mycena galopus ATCC 62051]|nr:hypothetical protein K438DRAFT_1846631 [Mycena galopus ATCC 62051]